MAAILKANDIKAAPYHAGLDSETRSKAQDDFLMEELDIIVATIAFGRVSISLMFASLYIMIYRRVWRVTTKKQDAQDVMVRKVYVCFLF